jgi:hypothetical protein
MNGWMTDLEMQREFHRAVLHEDDEAGECVSCGVAGTVGKRKSSKGAGVEFIGLDERGTDVEMVYRFWL